MEIIERLRELAFFNDIDEETLDQIKEKVQVRHVVGNCYVIREGEPYSDLFILNKGKSVVTKKVGGGVELEIATLKEGECFGEMSLITEEPCSANVKTIENCEFFVITKTDFEYFFKHNVFFDFHLSRMLCKRVKEGNQSRISQLEEVNKKIKRLNDSKSDFLMTVNKAVRTLVTEVKDARELFDKSPDTHIFLDQFQKNLKHVSSMIFDYLDISDKVSDKNIEKINMSQILEEVYEAFQVEAQKRKVNLIHNVNAKSHVFMEKGKMTRVLSAIIDALFKKELFQEDLECFSYPVCHDLRDHMFFLFRDRDVGSQITYEMGRFKHFMLNENTSVYENEQHIEMVICAQLIREAGGELWVVPETSEKKNFIGIMLPQEQN